MKRYLAALTVAACLMTGCALRPNTTPPSAAQAAAIGIDDFAALAKAAEDSEISLYRQGLIDKDTHLAIQKAFKQVGQDIQAIVPIAQTTTSKAALAIRIQTLTDDVNTSLAKGVGGIKNVQTRDKLINLVAALGKTAATLAGGN